MYLLFKYLRDTCKNWQSAECLSWAISFIRKKQGDFQPQSDFSGSFHALGLCPGSETEAVCCGKFYGRWQDAYHQEWNWFLLVDDELPLETL